MEKQTQPFDPGIDYPSLAAHIKRWGLELAQAVDEQPGFPLVEVKREGGKFPSQQVDL